MENASKALMMAGGVLIALMILGALILMFNNLSTYQNTNEQTESEAQIVKFNNQFVTYDNEDVRGSDLYSLLNKAIDYNRRQSIEGTGWSDSGQEIQFKPITISVEITKKDWNQFSPDGEARLIKHSSYTVSSTNNGFEDDVKETIDDLEGEYGSDSLTNLTTALTKIFLDVDNPSKNEKIVAIQNFNAASRKKHITLKSNQDSSVNMAYKELESYRDDVYKYYEYVQFKRLHFECTKTDYDNGRIVKMIFKSTGKFN